MGYTALVARVKTREFPGADNLLLGTCKGRQVIVGKDTKDDELGVLFTPASRLSLTFMIHNQLIRRKDSSGNPVGGLFAHNGRVRRIRLRGQVSEAFWCPLSYFKLANDSFMADDVAEAVSKLKEGDRFSQLAWWPVCHKYKSKRHSNRRRQSKFEPNPVLQFLAQRLIQCKAVVKTAYNIVTDALS